MSNERGRIGSKVRYKVPRHVDDGPSPRVRLPEFAWGKQEAHAEIPSEPVFEVSTTRQRYRTLDRHSRGKNTVCLEAFRTKDYGRSGRKRRMEARGDSTTTAGGRGSVVATACCIQ